MKTFLSNYSTFLAAVSLGLTACSVYSSSGRKALESGAYDIAAGTASLVACEQNGIISKTENRIIGEDDRAFVVQSQKVPSFVTVVLKNTPIPYSCYFQFTSENVVQSHLEDIVTYTLSQHKNHQ